MENTTIAVVGPKSRAVLAKVAPELAAGGGLEAEAFPFMTFRETTLASGVRAVTSGLIAPPTRTPIWRSRRAPTGPWPRGASW